MAAGAQKVCAIPSRCVLSSQLLISLAGIGHFTIFKHPYSKTDNKISRADSDFDKLQITSANLCVPDKAESCLKFDVMRLLFFC